MEYEVLLERDIIRNTVTMGKLYCGKIFYGYTCEDVIRQKKEYGDTAIPYGRYKLKITYSPKFKKELIEITGIPNYSKVYVHAGMSTKDTLGCPLLGAKRDTIKEIVYDCRYVNKRFFKWVSSKIEAGHDVLISIK